MSALLLVAAALAVAGVVVRKLARATSLYDVARKYGDPIHMALGALSAELFYKGASGVGPALAAFTLSLLYMAYQLSQRDESVPKDIAVYTAALATSLAVRFGIPWLP
ncbi:hypothetical protein [Pyrobaculum sp.]|uniref:hypothetical protein n=1 Tax=Pyrobaculum sp. TaxID=2004705 RepID=UPI003D0C9B1B